MSKCIVSMKSQYGTPLNDRRRLLGRPGADVVFLATILRLEQTRINLPDEVDETSCSHDDALVFVLAVRSQILKYGKKKLTSIFKVALICSTSSFSFSNTPYSTSQQPFETQW